MGFVLLLYWANGLLVVLCLWATGVPYSRLGIIAGLAVYTIGRLSTLVQVTPGGVGVVEFAYTAATRRTWGRNGSRRFSPGFFCTGWEPMPCPRSSVWWREASGR